MLSISNLHAAYGKVEVLHGISLDVPKGKVVTLIGSNGAGKTTTMRAISGMIKPKVGTVKLAGKDVTGLDSHKIARAGLAHSPEGRRVFATMSVTDNLLLGAFPRFTRSRPRGDVKADLEKALEPVVADVVSARELHEFLARDLEFIRIPQWALRLEPRRHRAPAGRRGRDQSRESVRSGRGSAARAGRFRGPVRSAGAARNPRHPGSVAGLPPQSRENGFAIRDP